MPRRSSTVESPESELELERWRFEELVLIHEWRAAQLRRLGVDPARAEELAELVDWHDVAQLVVRGCPVALAAEIVR
jgi:hypothetical protein